RRAIDEDLLPILPTLNLVLFPGVTIPLSLVRESTLRLAKMAADRQMPIGIVCQKNPEIEDPSLGDLCKYGVWAEVAKVFELPDGTHTAVVIGREKIKILGEPVSEKRPFDSILSAQVKVMHDKMPSRPDKELEVAAQQIRQLATAIIHKSPDAPDEMASNIEEIKNTEFLVNFLASHMPVASEVKQTMLAKHTIKTRAFELLSALQQHEQQIDLTRDILARTKRNMDESQRTAFLQQQLEALREELYGDDDDASRLEKRARDAGLPKDVETAVMKEIDKLRRTNPQVPDYNVSLNYVETVLDLPWHNATDEETDFKSAQSTLDADHYGLDKVKARILEQIAVMMNNPKGHSPILCLVGPPGVGKTSLGQSIAHALGRNYQRVSLGGLHDEAEIRGHRRTYIGAMPGRIIEAMKRAKSINPVLLLDEVDKIGADFKGDPSAALLEVLDPEQNCHFHDNFIDVDYDLSKVLFIATANTLQTLSQPLLDRMEIIDLSGYLVEEKIEIARRHLIPKQMGELNVTADDLEFTDSAIEAIIERYTSESGVRQLEKKLAAVIRKIILKKMSGDVYNRQVSVSDLAEYLGVEMYRRDKCDNNEGVGVVTGLAWTSVGGEILFIETSLSKGNDDKLTLTGNLGNVMKESAVIARQYLRSHADELGIDSDK
ncbi:MAG: endopeptidase La, partial [Muribaculaceae bacterium]|nr:endopeptidase La [Muribaculaceae bacterium]